MSPLSVPALFSNCSDEYRGQSDDKYLQCAVADGQDRCRLLKELHRAKDFRTLWLAFVPLVLGTIAIAVNLLLGAVCLRLATWGRIGGGSRKRLALLISRSACAVHLLLLYAALWVWQQRAFNFWTAALLLWVAVAQFVLLSAHHLATTFLLYTAVVHPLLYKSRVCMRHCCALIAAIWALSSGVALPFGFLGATLFYPQSAPISCPFDRCQRPVFLSLVLLLSLAYLLTIGCYALMLWRMHRRRGRVHQLVKQTSPSSGTADSASLQRNVNAMNRLSLNLLIFSVSKLPLVFVSFAALFHLSELSTLGLGQKSPCKTYLNGRLFFLAELLASLAAVVWLSGMAIDPAISIMADPRLRGTLARVLHQVPVPQRSLRSAEE